MKLFAMSGFCIFSSIKNYTSRVWRLECLKARPSPAIIRQRLVVLSNVLHFVLQHKLRKNVLACRKTSNVDE